MRYNKENEFIARFMGYENYQNTSIWIKNSNPKYVLCYDGFWSELMPVIDMLDTIHEYTGIYCNTSLTSHSFTVNYNSVKCINELHPKKTINRHRSESESKIENAFLAIYDFLEWYNLVVTPQNPSIFNHKTT